MPLDKSIRKVLLIGSGPIVIGQAAEFDYAGAQACKVLKQAGLDVVLVNSNPATIMTDQKMADAIYLEPLTLDTVKRIIEKEKPDSLLASLGGQTGLTLASQLDKEGFLAAHGVRLLGTTAHAIDRAEDRQLFQDTMRKIGQPVIPGRIATVLGEAVEIADEIGYPVIIRPAFTLGGAGGGVAYDREQLVTIVENGLWMSPISQVLVEKYIFGYKEIEFEVMRDRAGNVIAVCSMENFDPVGIHTGDSIVVAPALTLSDKEYQMLRSASLDIITELGIEGGCNCQFALNPDSFEYAVIEVNPRVSRSSALASKATGYPIAKVSAKIALGYTLDEIANEVTGKTCACFEPAIDYVVVKLPKWPFDKFTESRGTLGTQMKATGEVMAIAPSFEMALMKAVRGAEIKLDSLDMPALHGQDMRAALQVADTQRLFQLFEALRQGIGVDELHRLTRIDRWFLCKLEGLLRFEQELQGAGALTREQYLRGKKLGYLDKTLAALAGAPCPDPASAVYKMVDTCGGEFAAQTPYFYSSYDSACEARPLITGTKERVVVLGSGPIRIGQGIEFDYSSVHCVWTLKAMGYEVVIINNNPETVSTDYDTADRLYFEPLCEEDVLHILDVEKPIGVVVAFGGQTAIKLTKALDERGVRILGTSARSIDLAEDREQFDGLLERLRIKRPRGHGVKTLDEALWAANDLGYPVLVRPSYVIGGQNMVIAYSDEDVAKYMRMILTQRIENPVLVDKYLMGTELEVDAISDGERVLIPGVMEHVERAGVHSGDSIAVYPPVSLTDHQLRTVVECSTQLALAMETRGLVNIQYVLYQGELYVIEVNPRASRTIPYISKVTGVPMVDVATRLMLGAKLSDFPYGAGLYKTPPYYAAKVPVFSFEKLLDVNAAVGPEMKSTGEVLGIGKTREEALFKGLCAAGFRIPNDLSKKELGVLISVNKQDQYEVVTLAKKFADLGVTIYATDGTASAIEGLGVDVRRVPKLSESDALYALLEDGKLDYCVYTAGTDKRTVTDFIALHRRAAQLNVACLTSLDTAGALCDIIQSRFTQSNTELVDLNRMRTKRTRLRFAKMEGTGNDYIYCENFDGSISCPESLAISLSDRHRGIGGDGLVLIERSELADARMRMFNKDGSEGAMAGNSIRCVAKYLYDKGLVQKESLTIETKSGVKRLSLSLMHGQVSSVTVEIGPASLRAADLPTTLPEERLIDYPLEIAAEPYRVTCVSVGNPHCVVFCPKVDDVDLPHIGPRFEHASMFPERINTEFVRVVNPRTLKMRVWERGNGATRCCGTGACAAVVAATELGFCEKGVPITVKQKGGDLTVTYTDETVLLTGDARMVFEGEVEY